MGTITVTPNIGEGWTRVEVNWQDFTHWRKVQIFRKVAGAVDATRITLRDGDLAWLSNGVAVAFDHEAPLDTPIQYQSFLPLNFNGDFEDGVAEWLDTTNGGTIGTVTQSLDYYAPNAGRASLKLQPSGAAASKAVSEFIPATAATSYTFTGRLMVPDYWTGGIRLQIQWFNGATPLTTSQGVDDLTPYPGNWDFYTVTGTAPATTTQCKIAAVISGTPPTTFRLYADELYLSTALGTITSATVQIPSALGGWWTDPLHPWSKVRLLTELLVDDCGGDVGIVYLGVTDEEFPADSSLLEVNDSPYPVGTWNRRKSGRQSIRIGTPTMDDLARLKVLHDPGAPLFFNFAPQYREADNYALHGSLAVGRVHGDQKVEWRISQTSFGKVAAPIGPAEGTLRARYMDITRYDTFADTMAANGGVYDPYSRIVGAGGFGSAPAAGGGPAWPYTVTGTAAEYSVNGSAGLMSLATLTTIRRATVAISLLNVDLLNTHTLSAALTGAGGVAEFESLARFVDASNLIGIKVQRLQVGNAARVAVRQLVAGAETITAYVTIPGATSNSSISVRLTATGTTLLGWAWVAGTPQPLLPLVTLSSVTMLTAGGAGEAASLSAGVTNTLPMTATWDDLQVTNLATNGAVTWLDVLQGEASLQ